MPSKTTSTRATVAAGKSVRTANAKPRAKTVRLSKLEAKRLERFKALIQKYAGKGMFAGFDA